MARVPGRSLPFPTVSSWVFPHRGRSPSPGCAGWALTAPTCARSRRSTRCAAAFAPELAQAGEALQTAAADQTYVAAPQPLSADLLGTAAFCLFFGGTLADAAASGLCGVAIGISLIFMSRLGTNLFFKTIAGGFVSALAAVVLVALGLGTHTNLIIIGAIMALAPGVVITNFMRDIMAGDMLSGLSKFAEALLTGAGIALGTGLALSLARMLGGAA